MASQLAGGRDDHLPGAGVDDAGAERRVAAGAEHRCRGPVGPVARAQGQVAVGRRRCERRRVCTLIDAAAPRSTRPSSVGGRTSATSSQVSRG